VAHGRLLILAGILAVLVLVGYVGTCVQRAVSFRCPCRLLAQAEWLLLQAGEDALEASLRDRRGDDRRRIDLYRFQRGDVIRFRLAGDVALGDSVRAGQELARMESLELRQRLDQLLPQLDEARALLRGAETGERVETVDQIRGEIAAARARSERWDSESARVEALWRQGIASEAESEAAAARRREAAAELAALESKLRAAEAGEKEASVAAYRARVVLLEQQVRDAQAQIDGGLIRCPIAGRLMTLAGDSALVRVADVDTLYAVAPVPPSRAAMLRVGDGVFYATGGLGRGGVAGRLVRIDRHASYQGERTFFWVTAALPNPDGRLQPGIRGSLRFEGQEVSLLRWLADQMRHASDRSLGV